MRTRQVTSQGNFSLEADSDFDGTFETQTAKQTQDSNSNRDGFLPGFIDLPAEETDQSLPSQSTSEAAKPTPNESNELPTNVSVSASQTLPTENVMADSPAGTSQENTHGSSELVDLQGAPVETSDSQTATTAVPVGPLPSKEKDTPFDISDINPLWLLALVPVILIPLLLFRFVIGTSSSSELDRYRFRGPVIEDPEAENVRGRFKKRPRTDTSKLDIAKSDGGATLADIADKVPNTDASNEPDDKLSFLDEAHSDDSIDDSPVAAHQLDSLDLSDELSADFTSEPIEAGDFDLHAPENRSELATPNLGTSSLLSSESEPLNDQSDSDLDFDFFSDDDVQATDNAAMDGLEASSKSADAIDENLDDALASENLVSAETASNGSLDGLDESVSVDNASDESDDDFDFFGDEDDEFSLDDDAVPAATVSEAGNALEAEASDDDVFEMNEEIEESQDPTIETAVAAAAVGAAAVGATAVTAASTKGGSWVKRLFGGRKNKRGAEEIPEDDAIAAVAVAVKENEEEELDIEGVVSSEVNQLSVDNVVADATASGDGNLEPSEESNFSDSSEAFSLDGDDSSDGMFDDDSDVDYRFDAEEAAKPESQEIESFAISEANDDDSIDDFESLMEEQDEEPVNISIEPDASNDSFESINVVEDHAEPADLTTSLAGVESENNAEEFIPIGHLGGSEELPLLEDQMLDEIVDSENSNDSIGVANLGVSTGSTGLAALADQTSDANDALLAELQNRIEELESHNSAMESDRSSLMSELDELREVSENNQASAEQEQEQEQKREELEKQLEDERKVKQELEEQLTAEAEAKKLAAEEAEQAQAEAESAKAEAEKAAEEAEQARAEAEAAKAETEKAAAETAEFRQQAEEALASVRELKEAAGNQNSSLGMLGGSLVAAAGGAVAGAAITGDAEKLELSSKDDPFRLGPEQVKVMLKKLKDEKKKRQETKQYFLKVDAKRREVTKTLTQVTGELDNLKQEFQKITDASADVISKESVKELMAKLTSAEGALKKNKKLT